MQLFYYLRYISEGSTSVVGDYDEVTSGKTGESFIRLVPSMSMNLLYLDHSGFFVPLPQIFSIDSKNHSSLIMAPHNDIVLFHYQFSPYARRIIWYLTLRGIDYAQCIQPPYLPREDISALGVKYRRIPLMSIGRDIYCDTRLILQKLEERFPDGALGASQPDHKAVEKLLESWTIDGGIFMRAAQVIPPEAALMKDTKFTKDREEYTGRSWSEETVRALRPEALAHIRAAFEFLETGFLADGRDWVLKTAKPSLADIEG